MRGVGSSRPPCCGGHPAAQVGPLAHTRPRGPSQVHVPRMMKLVLSCGRSHTTSASRGSSTSGGRHGVLRDGWRGPHAGPPRHSPLPPHLGQLNCAPLMSDTALREQRTALPTGKHPSPSRVSRSLFTLAWKRSRTFLCSSLFLLYLHGLETHLVPMLSLPCSPKPLLYTCVYLCEDSYLQTTLIFSNTRSCIPAARHVGGIFMSQLHPHVAGRAWAESVQGDAADGR